MQRRCDAFGEHPGAEPGRCGTPAAGDEPAIEDERDAVGTADVDVLAHHLLEEHSTRAWPVQHLGQGELGLQDRDVVAVAGAPIGGGEGMREPSQPLAQQPIDLVRAEAVTDPLQPRGVVAGGETVVERLEPDPGLGCLAFGPLVAVDAQLGVVREVGGELDEERPEVLVDRVDVEVVHHRAGAHDPRVGRSRDRVAAFLGAEHRGALLGPAHEQHPLAASEAGQMLPGDVVFALPLGEVDQRHALVFGKAVNVGNERPTDRFEQHRRREAVPTMLTQE